MNLCYLQYDCVVALSAIVAKQFVNRKQFPAVKNKINVAVSYIGLQ